MVPSACFHHSIQCSIWSSLHFLSLLLVIYFLHRDFGVCYVQGMAAKKQLKVVPTDFLAPGPFPTLSPDSLGFHLDHEIAPLHGPVVMHSDHGPFYLSIAVHLFVPACCSVSVVSVPLEVAVGSLGEISAPKKDDREEELQ